MYIITVSGVKHPVSQSFVSGTRLRCKYILSGSLSFMKSPMTQNQKGLVNYMNTVFIADDELIIRQGLKCIIDWESLGFSIIGEASNGIDALDYIVREQRSNT